MKKEINENKALSQTSVSGSFTVEDMIGFADWCRNGLLNTEYSIDRIHEHLEAWILQHRKDVITLKIEFEDWHYQCGDKCCDNYGTDIYLNDKKLDEQYAEDELFEAGIIAGLDYSKTILQETLKLSISLLMQTTEFEVLESFKLKVTELQKVLEETES